MTAALWLLLAFLAAAYAVILFTVAAEDVDRMIAEALADEAGDWGEPVTALAESLHLADGFAEEVPDA